MGDEQKRKHKNEKNISSLYKIENFKRGDRQKIKHMSLCKDEEIKLGDRHK
jgi:hypothetical protein